jgi:hypothetical protein
MSMSVSNAGCIDTCACQLTRRYTSRKSTVAPFEDTTYVALKFAEVRRGVLGEARALKPLVGRQASANLHTVQVRYAPTPINTDTDHHNQLQNGAWRCRCTDMSNPFHSGLCAVCARASGLLIFATCNLFAAQPRGYNNERPRNPHCK